MKEESLLLLSDLQKLINQVVLIDYTIIILGGNSMKNYQTLIGFALVAIAIIIAAVIISGALNDFASSVVSGLSYLADHVRG